jgi:two-component system alkaline phosphatase synthesis response regulator PhoP
MTSILIVDDEPSLVWAMQLNLADEGYKILTAHDGETALALARRHPPDLIVLDILMPRLDGIQVCRKLRQDPGLAAIPVLFLTALSAVQDRIAGLDHGGDDYMVKPFDLGELKARIRALLRRSCSALGRSWSTGRQDSRLRLGDLALDLNTSQLDVDGQTVQLTPTEFELLYFLMTHPGEAFSSQQLLEQVWGYSPDSADSSLVRWHIKNLRTKIERDPESPVHLPTIPRHGYFLQAQPFRT